MKPIVRLLCAGLLCLPALAQARLEVFACEPEWRALVQELAGERARIVSATSALQDPHRIEARPSLIAQLRRADLLVCTGAGLEAGWLPLLLRESANPAVQPGRPGHVEAAAFVTLRDRPAILDRAHGDVHAEGNPHLHTDPRNIARVAAGLAERLAAVDPANAADYRARHADFAGRWQAAIARWEAEAAVLRDQPVVFQHRSWVYLAEWLGLREAAVLEPKPGVPPSVTHLATVLEGLRAAPARAIVRAAYEHPRPAAWLAQRAQLPVVVLPYTVGGDPEAGDLFALFDLTVARLRAALAS
jgi:zinc/manganese transport system substrate-binding protein